MKYTRPHLTEQHRYKNLVTVKYTLPHPTEQYRHQTRSQSALPHPTESDFRHNGTRGRRRTTRHSRGKRSSNCNTQPRHAAASVAQHAQQRSRVACPRVSVRCWLTCPPPVLNTACALLAPSFETGPRPSGPACRCNPYSVPAKPQQRQSSV